MSKIISEFSVGKYKVLKLDFLPSYPYTSVRINGQKYEVTPSYDLPNCIVIESSDKFIGNEISFE